MASSVGKSRTELERLSELPLHSYLEAEEACKSEADKLSKRLFDAAEFQTRLDHTKIIAALDRWQQCMPWRRKAIRRGICQVPTFNLREFTSCVASESHDEAIRANLVFRATRNIVGQWWETSPAVVSMTACATRLSSVQTGYPGGYLRIVSYQAAVAIGAAAAPSLIHYRAHLPLLEAFEAGCMFVWERKDELVYAERPYVFHRDDRDRAHCGTGPAIVWYDGIQYHFWHGSHVDARVILTPADKINVHMVDNEWNIENRRVLLDRMGEDRYIQESGLKPVDHDHKFGTLYYKEFPNGRPICRLRVVNRSPEPDGTYKIYWLPINPDKYDGEAGVNAHAAAASTWRTTPGGDKLFFRNWHDYDPMIET